MRSFCKINSLILLARYSSRIQKILICFLGLDTYQIVVCQLSIDGLRQAGGAGGAGGAAVRPPKGFSSCFKSAVVATTGGTPLRVQYFAQVGKPAHRKYFTATRYLGNPPNALLHRVGVRRKRQFLQVGGAYKGRTQVPPTAPWEPAQRTGLGMLTKREEAGEDLSLKTILTN